MTETKKPFRIAKSVWLALASAMSAAGWASLVRADTVTLGAAADNTMYAEDGTQANGAGSKFFVGSTALSELRRALIRFDLTAIPAGSTINSVTLTLFCSRTRSPEHNISLYRLTASWGEGSSNASGNEGSGTAAAVGDATWTHRFFDATLWDTPGGTFNPTPSASTAVNDDGFFYSWSAAGMVANVQSWVNSPATNFGWILIGNESTNQTTKRFESRQSTTVSQRPALTINYTPGTLGGACCLTSGACTIATPSACNFQGGTYQGNNTPCTPDPCPDPSGACCFVGGACQSLTQLECAAQGGAYHGDGVTCSPDPCPLPDGACCRTTGYCREMRQAECAAESGDYQGDGILCDAVSCPIPLVPFVDPLPLPGVAQPVSGIPGGAAHYVMAIAEFTQTLHRDLPATTVWGYAGTYPGPTFEARRDLPVTVEWVNDLRLPQGDLRTMHYLPVDTCLHGPDMTGETPVAVVHLHGGHVPSDSDGHPEAAFPPGQQSSVYTYPNSQPAATLWYHDHALGITRLNVYMGLAGFYLVRDDAEDAMNLPRGEFEIPLAIQDRSFNPDGTLKYHDMWHEHFFGDFVLVNGKVWPFLSVKQGKYRFRMLNGSNSRMYTLALANGAAFWQIGTDTGLLPSPVSLTSLTIAPGERADVVMDFAPYAAGAELVLTNSAPAPFPGDPGEGVIPDVMKFVVMDQPGDTDVLPSELVPVPPILESEAARSRDFELRKMFDPACGHDMWMINELMWDEITEYPRLGRTEIWNWINRSGSTHPMHLHLVSFQVLDRQDFIMSGEDIVPTGPRVPPPASEAGWKDTVQANPDQITRVIARFEDFAGVFTYHCHILEHEDHEMMRQFRTVPLGDVDFDGDVDLADYTKLADCLAGPDVTPAPPPPTTPATCLEVFDFDNDQDVDLFDVEGFQVGFGNGS